jgi:hypothetical protein
MEHLIFRWIEERRSRHKLLDEEELYVILINGALNVQVDRGATVPPQAAG